MLQKRLAQQLKSITLYSVQTPRFILSDLRNAIQETATATLDTFDNVLNTLLNEALNMRASKPTKKPRKKTPKDAETEKE